MSLSSSPKVCGALHIAKRIRERECPDFEDIKHWTHWYQPQKGTLFCAPILDGETLDELSVYNEQVSFAEFTFVRKSFNYIKSKSQKSKGGNEHLGNYTS